MRTLGTIERLCLYDTVNVLFATESFTLKWLIWDFPGGPVVKTSPSNAGGEGSIPGQGAKIPHPSWPKNQNVRHK